MILAVLFALCASRALASTDLLITYKLPISNEVRKAIGYVEGSYQNFTERVSSNGYKAEQHQVTTEDGYKLTVFRARSPDCTQLKSLPMLLIHGIFQNSDVFIEAGKNTSLLYLLADECYDVWVVNLRGNDYSRAHTTLNPDDDPAFWRYSADEQGYYDAPATIDYILEKTGAQKLNVAGFSLGGQVPIIMLADRPEYNDKVNLYLGLAPSVITTALTKPFLKLLTTGINALRNILQSIGIYEVFFKTSILQVLLEFLGNQKILKNFAAIVIFLTLDSYHKGSIGDLTGRSVFSHLFVGSSVQQVAKLGQDSLNPEFSRYDYGTEGNLKKYGSETAPAFELSNVVVPAVLITGLSDEAVPNSSVHLIGSLLPNTVAVVDVPDPKWNHVDIIYSQEIPTVFFPIVKKYLDLYNP